MEVNPADGVRAALEGFGMPDLTSLSDTDLAAWEAEFLKIPNNVNDWRVQGYIDIIRAEAAARRGEYLGHA